MSSEPPPRLAVEADSGQDATEQVDEAAETSIRALDGKDYRIKLSSADRLIERGVLSSDYQQLEPSPLLLLALSAFEGSARNVQPAELTTIGGPEVGEDFPAGLRLDREEALAAGLPIEEGSGEGDFAVPTVLALDGGEYPIKSDVAQQLIASGELSEDCDQQMPSSALFRAILDFNKDTVFTDSNAIIGVDLDRQDGENAE